MVTALLPGIEEEGSEFYDRVRITTNILRASMSIQLTLFRLLLGDEAVG